uniref:ANAPC4_WD40 domain-containing protein n=1 Tax=Steinernema glaseri TaxID=37863 RepID=A0A1I8AX13_9BILA
MSYVVSFNSNASCLTCGDKDGFAVYKVNDERIETLKKFVDVGTDGRSRIIKNLHRTRFVLTVSEGTPTELVARILPKKSSNRAPNESDVIDTLKCPTDILSVRINPK